MTQRLKKYNNQRSSKVFDEKPFRDQQNDAYRQFNSCSKLKVLWIFILPCDAL